MAKSTLWDEGWNQAVLACLAVVAHEGDTSLWQSVLSQCGDPVTLHRIAERDGLLETAGFIDNDDEYRALLKRERERPEWASRT